MAFNAKKNGSLEYLYFEGCELVYSNFLTHFCSNLWISEHDHEQWYGDQQKAAKMQGDDFKKVFYCNLKNFSYSNNKLVSNFNLNSFKKEYKPDDPSFTKFIQNNSNLQLLNLKGCSLKK